LIYTANEESFFIRGVQTCIFSNSFLQVKTLYGEQFFLTIFNTMFEAAQRNKWSPFQQKKQVYLVTFLQGGFKLRT
jgi:hypothetical protein